MAELDQPGLLHPPSAIGQRSGGLQTPPGGQALQGRGSRKATITALEQRRTNSRRDWCHTDWGSKAAAKCSSSTASKARKPLVQKAPVKASSQKGSASLGGSSGKATASTNITSKPLAVAAARPANR